MTVGLRSKELFLGFRNDLVKVLEPPKGTPHSDVTAEDAAAILKAINEFFYQKYDAGNIEYISKFHAFWKENSEQILGFRIDESQCRKVAAVLERVYSSNPFKVDANVRDLSHDLIANVRYFSVVQDFKERIKDPYVLARTRPELFDAKSIISHFPDYTNQLLNYLGTDSQTDKRLKFSKLCAELLLQDYNGTALDIATVNQNNPERILETLVSNPDPKFKKQLGFSAKKAIILIRDMMDLGIWKIRNPEILDLPSDANTMKVALKTGILRTGIPLLASYLDVYCFQYGSTDKWCREAWRKVWELWGKIPNNHRLSSPAFFDFLIYRSGQNWKKPDKMPAVRLLREICPKDTLGLNPPKSISIFGKTGWERGKTDAGGGGGISS